MYFYVFQNVLQMLSSALKTHLHTSRKIVNDSHTFLLGDLPDLSCDCCLQFTYCLRIVLIHIVLEIPPQITIWGFKSGECAAHSTSHLLLDEHEPPQTVNTERYVAALRKFWTSLGRRRGMDRDRQWFQQDGATPTHQMSS